MVAENKKVFLVLGIISRIVFISLSKSIFNNLSASSRTKNFNALRWNPFVFSKWYNIFPGVPITTWGFYDRALAYANGSIPPKITTDFNAIDDPIAWKCSWIYTQSSLVGDKIRAKNGYGSSNNDCNIGNANAKVLPEPVSASAIISCFFKV